MATRITFEEWLPDQPSVTSLREAKNVYPTSVGYSPFPNAVDFSDSASENLNSVFGSKYDDVVAIFGVSANELYKLDASDASMDIVSKSGGYGGSTWKFAQFGNKVLAANDQAKVQAYTINVSSLFADLDSTAPIAKFITVVRDFVVCANLDNGTNPNKVQWSDINDETTWSTGSTSQSDSQVIPDGGNITGVTGGEIGLIFLEKSIVRMSYVGSPLYFQFDTISRGLGCLNGNSIAQYGATSFFLSDDGFYKCDGNAVTGIGTEKVDRHFFNDADQTDFDSMSASVDPIRKLVMWNYKTVDGARRIIIYNWQLNKWSYADTDANGVGSITTTGYTLESMVTSLGYNSIDDLPASLDDPLWVGGRYVNAGFKDDKIVTFTGSTYDSELITPDIEVGYNSVCTLVRPQVDNGSADVKVASRKELTDNIQFGSSVSASSEGRASVRSAGRYHRFSISPTGNWTNAVSIDVDFRTQGNR